MPPTSSRALAVFAKRPIPGHVKTRLTPALSPEQAADLYWAMVQDTWAMARQLPDIDLHLFVDQPWDGFDALADGRRIALQASSVLNHRMYSCLQSLTDSYLKPSIIIGTDSPTLPTGYIQAAFDTLVAADDAVLGPAEDGGYYLVGCRQAKPGMFDGVEWSSVHTLAETRKSFDVSGYRTRLTPVWRDVDSIEDVQALAAGPVGAAVGAWLEQNRI